MSLPAILQLAHGHPAGDQKIGPHRLLHFQKGGVIEPVEKLSGLPDVGALRQEDDHAAGFHGVNRIVDGLLGLVEVDILRIAAGRGDDDVGLFLNSHAEDIVHQAGSRLPSRNPVAGKNTGNITIQIGDHVDDKIRLDKCGRFHHVFVGRVASGLHVGG